MPLCMGAVARLTFTAEYPSWRKASQSFVSRVPRISPWALYALGISALTAEWSCSDLWGVISKNPNPRQRKNIVVLFFPHSLPSHPPSVLQIRTCTNPISTCDIRWRNARLFNPPRRRTADWVSHCLVFVQMWLKPKRAWEAKKNVAFLLSVTEHLRDHRLRCAPVTWCGCTVMCRAEWSRQTHGYTAFSLALTFPCF